MGVVELLQDVVAGLGLGQVGHALLQQFLCHPGGEAEEALPHLPGLSLHQVLGADGAEDGAAVQGPGDKGQGPLGNQQVGQAAGLLRAGAGNDVTAPLQKALAQVGQKGPRQAALVPDLIDPLAQGGDGCLQQQPPLAGGAAQEAPGLLPRKGAGGAELLLQQGGRPPGGPGQGLLGVEGGSPPAAVLCRLVRQAPLDRTQAPVPSGPLPPLRLDTVIADAAITYCKLCGFILYFRLLAGGLGAVGADLSLPAAMILEVCSGCDLASRTGRWASWLCCAAISLQGTSVLLQVRTICPGEISFRPLLAARLLHLPLSLMLFRLLLWLPGGAVTAGKVMDQTPVVLRRVPPDCAVLILLGCCLLVCYLNRSLPGPD